MNEETRKVAELFFTKYVDQPVEADEIIDAIAELIGYCGDLEVIRFKMSLDIEG